MNDKKILVTGGTGFIGAALVKRLIKNGNTVRVLDDNSRGSMQRLNDIIDYVEVVDADIRDAQKVKRASEGIEIIIHLAAINGTEFFYSKPKMVLDVGVKGMLNVLDAGISEGVKELFVASSSEVYQTPDYIPTDEKVSLKIPDALNPRYSYAGSKLISELLTINYGRTDLERAVIFRPHNVYGPDMGYEHVLPQFILRAKKAVEACKDNPLPFSIQGDGNQTRSFIHIDDFISGLMCLLEKGKNLNIYNIGNPEELTINEVAKKVVTYFGREPLIIHEPGMIGSTQRRCPDIRKLKELGFMPKISLDTGLKLIIEWYLSHSNEINNKYVGGNTNG